MVGEIASAVSWLPDWQFEAIVRMFAAAGLGALIGLEREHHGRSAGLRTQLLVALGAALTMIVSLHFGRVFGDSPTSIRVDPGRVAYGVMTGVGFLGAGAIIHYGPGVRGLTTAASLWCSAAIGLACGFGLFAISTAATVMVLVALTTLDFAARRIRVRDSKTFTLTVPAGGPEAIEQYRRLLTGGGKRIKVVDFGAAFTGDWTKLTFHVSLPAGEIEGVIARLREKAPEITEMSVS